MKFVTLSCLSPTEMHCRCLRLTFLNMVCGRFYTSIFLILTLITSVIVVLYVYFLAKDLRITTLRRFHRNSLKNNSLPVFQNSSCTPKKNIVFLKTHKCASSTVQNILFRYGDDNQLNFVLPISGHYLGAVIPFHRKMITGTPWHIYGYNIFTQHTIFNENEIRAIMPSNSIYISILREPVSLFESLYTYARFDVVYNKDIENFARSPKPFGNKTTRVSGHLGRNQMLYDLGFDANYFEDNHKVQEYISKLDSIFDLMLIVEYFDESLILLRHLLCWDLDDIVYFKHNARANQHLKHLSNDVRILLRDYNAADLMLYNYFLNKFKAKVKAFGPNKMNEEVAQLRKRNQEWHERCDTKAIEANTLRDSAKTWSKQVIGFKIPHTVRNTTCFNLAKAEIPYTSRLRFKQINRSILKAKKLYGGRMAGIKRPETFDTQLLRG